MTLCLSAAAIPNRTQRPRKRPSELINSSGFTLIELVLVIVIIGLVFGVVGLRGGSFDFWKEEGFIRRIAETLNFLHHQAVVDQAFYRMR